MNRISNFLRFLSFVLPIFHTMVLLLFCSSALLIALPAMAGVVATIPLPDNSANEVDVNSVTNRIYTSGGASFGQTVTVID